MPRFFQQREQYSNDHQGQKDQNYHRLRLQWIKIDVTMPKTAKNSKDYGSN